MALIRRPILSFPISDTYVRRKKGEGKGGREGVMEAEERGRKEEEAWRREGRREAGMNGGRGTEKYTLNQPPTHKCAQRLHNSIRIYIGVINTRR